MANATFINEFNGMVERTEASLAELIQRPYLIIPEINRLSEKLRSFRAVTALVAPKLAKINDQRDFEAIRTELQGVKLANADKHGHREGVELAWDKIDGLAYDFLPTANEA